MPAHRCHSVKYLQVAIVQRAYQRFHFYYSLVENASIEYSLLCEDLFVLSVTTLVGGVAIGTLMDHKGMAENGFGILHL